MNRHAHRSRQGMVGLVLVLILTLLVGTFASLVVSRASQERRRESERHTIAMLQSAIDAVNDAGLPLDNSYRLPLDQSEDRYILVEPQSTPGTPDRWRATLWHYDKLKQTLERPVISPQSLTGEYRQDVKAPV